MQEGSSSEQRLPGAHANTHTLACARTHTRKMLQRRRSNRKKNKKGRGTRRRKWIKGGYDGWFICRTERIAKCVLQSQNVFRRRRLGAGGTGTLIFNFCDRRDDASESSKLGSESPAH